MEWGILLHRARGYFLIKPLNLSVLHRAINAICRSRFNPQFPNLSPQGCFIDTQLPGRRKLFIAVPHQRFLDGPRFRLCKRSVSMRCSLCSGRRNTVRKMLGKDKTGPAQNESVLDSILQFTNISLPSVMHEIAERFLRNPGDIRLSKSGTAIFIISHYLTLELVNYLGLFHSVSWLCYQFELIETVPLHDLLH